MADVPYRALGFMAHTAVAIGRHGIAKGAAQAAAGVSPAMLIIEAAVSVVRAIGSLVDLETAKAERDALRRMNPLLVTQLRLRRGILENAIANARTQLEQEREVRGALESLVSVTREAFSTAMSLCVAELQRQLPGSRAVEEQQDRLVDAWGDLKRALQGYQSFQSK